MSKSWRERNAEARERGAFTAQDRKDVCDWGTCFVGEHVQKGALPWDWAPDSHLVLLGCHAVEVVMNHRFNEADRLMDAIEDRVLELKREARQ